MSVPNPVSQDRGKLLLIGAGAASVALWVIPELRLALWPLTLFNTYVHELCHAFATVLTGGSVVHIVVEADGNGLTLSNGGWGLVIVTAGYIGSSVVGGGVLSMSRDSRSATRVLMALAAVMAVALLLVVRGTVVGWLMGLVWTFGLAGSARYLPDEARVFMSRFLGFQLCLTSLHSLSDLVVLARRGGSVTDAVILQDMIGVPATFTSLVWSAVGLATVVLAVRQAWREEKPGKARAA